VENESVYNLMDSE